MTDGRAAKRYAKALFNAAKSQDAVHQVDDDLVMFAQVLRQSDHLRTFFFSPLVADKEKVDFVDKTLAAKMHPLTVGLLKLATAKGRINEIIAIQLEHGHLRREYESVVKAVVEFAQEVDQKAKDEVVAKIGELTGKAVEAEFSVNPALIGGVRVTYNDNVLDGSARGHLNRLREALLRDALKQV